MATKNSFLRLWLKIKWPYKDRNFFFKNHFLFSWVKNGAGYLFFIIGSLFFFLLFHFKLHTIKESSSRNPLEMFSIHSLIGFFFLIIYIVFRLIYFNLDFHKHENVIADHMFYLVNVTLFCIIVPKYYINQIPNLKLYASVYFHQPPPVLSWQLPQNYDSNSVNIDIA